MASMTGGQCGISTASVKGDGPICGEHTAALPCAAQAYSGAMDTADGAEATRALYERIQRRLSKLELAPRRAEELADATDAIRNIGKAVKKGLFYSPRTVTLDAIAMVLKTTPEWLLHEKGPEDIEDALLAKAALRLAGDPSRMPTPDESATPSGPTIREIDLHAGMGAGGVPAGQMVQIINSSTYAADAVRGHWVFPPYALAALGIDPNHADIVRGIGDSMEPDIRSGDWCVVDRRHRVPSPDGIYALWDGFSVVFKSLQLIPNSDPVAVRIMSKNSAYASYDRTLEEVAVIGRVVSVVRAL